MIIQQNNYLNFLKSNYKYLVSLCSNGFENSHYTNIIAAGNKKADFHEKGKWLFGHISYDYKNQIENLNSDLPDFSNFPDTLFFEPEIIILEKVDKIDVITNLDEKKIKELLFKETPHQNSSLTKKKAVKSRISKEHYLNKLDSLINHIQRGDIYEINFCKEFYIEDITVNPIEVYSTFNQLSPSPFSCFYKCGDNYLISGSPERFIQKKGNKVISQPIKGTAKRGKTESEDIFTKKELEKNQKERSENIMIVDLVRSDLSRIAKKNTVKVDELCKVYTFPLWHQMISTVSCEVEESISFNDILKATFPPGSMTGAPKISAMKLIEKYETVKRGIYSGSVGYIKPNGDFDFNVVIRSIEYNSKTNYVSYKVGGAITAKSIPEKEYEECLIKAKPFFKIFEPDESS